MKMKIARNMILAQCILYCFRYFLYSMLESVLILFPINTWIVTKDILFCLSCIQWEKSNKLTLKIELIILQWHYQYQKFWCKVVKNWQKIIQRHWHLKHWVYHKEKNWWLWKYLQCGSFVFIYWSCKWIC